MPEPRQSLPLAPLALIAVIIGLGAVAFAYTAGWFSPARISPAELVDTFTPPGAAPPLGHRRNHAKGICFTGVFEANGAGSELSRAEAFARGSYPVLGRFNLATPDPNAADATVRVRGLGIRITTPDGQQWRSAMIDAPFFAASTPQTFYQLLSLPPKDLDAMKAYAATHPAFVAFGGWAKSAPWTASYAEERFNGLNAFIFTNGSGAQHAVRWSLVPVAQPVAISPADLAKRSPDFLEEDIAQRVAGAPQRWTLVLIVANPGDQTADPSKAWPSDRRTVTAGTLVVQQIIPERNGPCRDINFDPTVLPSGIKTSDDPFPAARSAAYSVSFNRRTAEEADYPRTTKGAQP